MNRAARAAATFALCLAALLLAAGRGHPAAAGGEAILAAWVEIGEADAVIARVVTTASACPVLVLDGRAAPAPMAERAAPSDAFPVRVCEATLGRGVTAATVEDRRLPLPVANPRRIIIVGDTGCRIERGEPVQACNDPAAWPWAGVARAAADSAPDLVVHVGDYVYREAPCPAGDAGCAGSSYGDDWATWYTDFFLPAAPLLRAAPWLMVRGNHESCARQGGGWFRLLDPRPYAGACSDYAEPYAVAAGDPAFIVFDSSNADDEAASPEQVALYREQFARARRLLDRDNVWFLTHRPIWAAGVYLDAGRPVLFRDNPTLQAASQGNLPRGVRLVVSGHLHSFQVLEFAAPRPPQLVVGMSGTALDPPVTLPVAGTPIGGALVTRAAFADRVAYFTMEPFASGWIGTLRDPERAAIGRCSFVPYLIARFSCADEPPTQSSMAPSSRSLPSPAPPSPVGQPRSAER